MKKGILLLGFTCVLFALPLQVAAQERSILEEMQQQLQQMQQRMMQGLQGFGDGMDSSGLSFHFDTSFNGGSAHFFQFSPPGDSLSTNPSGLEEFFREMFDFGGSSGSAGAQTFPRDDGNMPHPDDELLPEDRLRQQNQQPADSRPAPAKPKAPPAKKKPPVESIRI